jgi:acylphosphatase
VDNGNVEGYVEGSREAVLRLEGFIRKGPSFSYVTGYESREVSVEGHEGFSIVR